MTSSDSKQFVICVCTVSEHAMFKLGVKSILLVLVVASLADLLVVRGGKCDEVRFENVEKTRAYQKLCSRKPSTRCHKLGIELDELDKEVERICNGEPKRKYATEAYSLTFSQESLRDYVAIQDAPSMSSITTCLWVKSTIMKSRESTFLSYATQAFVDSYSIYIVNSRMSIMVGGSWKESDVEYSVDDGKWHTLCFTWSRSGGVYQFYGNGRLRGKGQGLATGFTISGGGVWVLDHEQDSLGGGFDVAQMYLGEMSNVNVWDRVLSAEEIAHFSSSCISHFQGNVKKWDNFRDGVNGQVMLTEKSSCPAAVNETTLFHFRRKSILDYVKLNNASTMSAITTCLWMRTPQLNTAETNFLTYATSSSTDAYAVFITHSEMAIMIDGHWKTSGVKTSVDDRQWHALCYTWSNQEGQYRFYLDGNQVGKDAYLKAGYTLGSGGVWILGQEQDSVGGDFDVTQMFLGEISDVNVWDRLLTHGEIQEFSSSCVNTMEGNVKKWKDFYSAWRHGNVFVSTSASCR